MHEVISAFFRIFAESFSYDSINVSAINAIKNNEGGHSKRAAVKEFFEAIPGKVNPDKIQGMNSTYQFNITGDNGGDFWVKVADGAAEVGEGTADSSNITLTISDENFEALVTGKLNGQTAFLTGKLKIQGDMTLAMKLQSVFNLGG